MKFIGRINNITANNTMNNPKTKIALFQNIKKKDSDPDLSGRIENESQPSCLGAVMQSIFPKKSNWIDIYMFENSGKYKLIQMRYRLDNNKKEFRTASIGFVNDYTVKLKIYENVLLERS